jgi:diguanylate cyclase (GGDEF)-like protein
MTTASISISLTGESERPMIVKFLEWYRENRRSVLDLVALSILAGLTFYIVITVDVAEAFYQFSRLHESWQLDEIMLSVAIILPTYISIFAIRRWIEAIQHLKLANADSLTGLFNRRKGWETLEFEITRAKRYDRPLSVIMLDIDHFKAINDKYGHVAGDGVLNEISKILQKNLRSTDILARWGGEEFIIISTETNLRNASQVAERLRLSIERDHLPKVDKVTASFGVVEVEKEDDIASLMQRVDGRLYQAKASGRNRVAF